MCETGAGSVLWAGCGFYRLLVFPGRFRLKMILRFASSMTESSSEAR